MRIVWKHQPLDFHKDAPLAHLASLAAHEQGKFWEFHDKLFANHPKIQRQFLLQYAAELGLDVPRFQAAIDARKHADRIDADVAEAGALGSTGTPAFFVNGRFLSGAKPFAEFAKVINAELVRLKLPIPAAAQPAQGG